MSTRVLIVDDEPKITSAFASLLKEDGYLTVTAGSAEEGSKVVGNMLVDVILLDIQLPGRSGLAWLEELKSEGYPAEVLMVSGQADIPMAMQAVKHGAVDFLEKPVQPEKLLSSVAAAVSLSRANRQRALHIEDLDEQSTMIGDSAAMHHLRNTLDRVAPSDSTVLITGESGTGKELVATRLFLASGRRERPFVRVNCPGIPETLFESELFGHLKGAFTGAVKDHPGKFAMADGGTILLDEIGDLPMPSQAKLLRVLETGEVETLGATERRHVDVRLICATNRDLKSMVERREFREDLYYRISVIVIDAPPLSARRDDIPLLIGHFLNRFDPTGRTTLSIDAIAYLRTLPYRGNVRQLKNLIERLCILYGGKQITTSQITAEFGPEGVHPAPEAATSLADKLAGYEKFLIERAVQDADGNIAEAARTLGVDRANLSRKVRELGLKDQ